MRLPLPLLLLLLVTASLSCGDEARNDALGTAQDALNAMRDADVAAYRACVLPEQRDAIQHAPEVPEGTHVMMEKLTLAGDAARVPVNLAGRQWEWVLVRTDSGWLLDHAATEASLAKLVEAALATE